MVAYRRPLALTHGLRKVSDKYGRPSHLICCGLASLLEFEGNAESGNGDRGSQHRVAQAQSPIVLCEGLRWELWNCRDTATGPENNCPPRLCNCPTGSRFRPDRTANFPPGRPGDKT